MLEIVVLILLTLALFAGSGVLHVHQKRVCAKHKRRRSTILSSWHG